MVFKNMLILVGALALPFVTAHPSVGSGFERDVASVNVVQTRSADSPFQIQLKAFEHNLNLNLRRPASSIFTKGFTFGTATVYQDEKDRVESDMYVDVASKSALHVVNNGGSHEVNGVVGDFTIKHENGVHYATRMIKSAKERSATGHPKWCETPESPMPFPVDFSNVSTVPQGGAAVVEIQALIDTKLAALLGSRENMTRYVGIHLHASNVIFSELTNPSVSLKLAGILPLNAADTKTLTKDIKDGGNTMTPSFRAFITWLQTKHDGLGPGDIMTLFTGIGSGVGVVGVANLAAACTGSNVAIVQDPGAVWQGSYPLTHEIGHSVGCTHDFENNCGEGGYIMGYKPGTLNYFHWSDCSKQEISAKANSRGGACYYRDDAGTNVQQGTSDPGEEPSMTFQYQCERTIRNYFKDESLQVTYNPDYNPAETACSAIMTCIYGNSGMGMNVAAEGTSCNQSAGDVDQEHASKNRWI